jgi:hypothetical protein
VVLSAHRRDRLRGGGEQLLQLRCGRRRVRTDHRSAQTAPDSEACETAAAAALVLEDGEKLHERRPELWRLSEQRHRGRRLRLVGGRRRGLWLWLRLR